MGTSSRPRKNPFEGQGLVPGLTLHLEFAMGQSREALVTQVEDVDETALVVLVPIQHMRKRPIPAGQSIAASYVHQRLEFSFVSTVLSHSEDGEYDVLEAPRMIHSEQRRRSFRLATSLRPTATFRLVVNRENPQEDGQMEIEATVVDISEGGVCLSTRSNTNVGERLGIQVELPQVGQMTARMRVVAVEEPLDGRRNRRVHCAFTGLGRPDRERIAKYLMRRQIEMRRRGQL